MSNYLGRKTEYTPTVYTRYFEQTETRKSPHGHVYFNDNDEEQLSKNYQIKRDLIFKRLFPSKYKDSNDEKTESTQINQNGNNHSTAESLGDYISLSNDNSSTEKKQQSSPQPDVIISSSDEKEDDLLIEEQLLPNSRHKSIVGHIHPRSTIENVRAILIRELYERTSDPHTEWLKCKMNIPKNYINPKYYADFQRRYKKEIERNTTKKSKSISNKNTTENNYSIVDLTTTQINQSVENGDVIETSSIINSPEFIVLDSDSDDNDNPPPPNQDIKSKYFIDRSSTSLTEISQPTTILNDDYHTEDSKYAQLPTRNISSSPSIIRPIISKHQRRKKPHSNNSVKPLVSAIDRIIDHMDQSNELNNSKTTMEQQNLLIKQIKKRKKKKKKKPIKSTTNKIVKKK